MATTGDLPPNTRSGQNFIHDPKIAGETEVKAQIKLGFHGSSNQPFMVIRGFQLTQKKTTLQFKQLDTSLVQIDPETGQSIALPGRCADINALVPVVMGVSKAILENVIFVHQEDSNWPLAEGTVLKKRFDDIFAATKYTKALDELRKLKKEQVTSAKEMRLKRETLKTHKDHAMRLKSTLADNNERAAVLQNDIRDLEHRLVHVRGAQKEANSKLNSIADLADDIVTLQARYDSLVVKNAESYARMVTIVDSSDLEMSAEEIGQFERDLGPKLQEVAAKIRNNDREMQSTFSKVKALKEQSDRELCNYSRLRAEADAHERNILERDRFLLEKMNESSVEPERMPLDETSVQVLKSRFQIRLEAALRKLQEARGQTRRHDDELGNQLDEISAKISRFQQERRMKEDAFNVNNKRKKEVDVAIDELEAGGSDNVAALDSVRTQLREAQNNLSVKEKALKESSLEEDGHKMAEELSSLAIQIDTLRQQRAELAAAAEDASKMNFSARELSMAEKKRDDLLSRHRSNISRVLGLAPDELPEALLDAVKEAVQKREEDADRAEAESRTAQDKASKIHGTLEATRAQLLKDKEEAIELAHRLKAGVDGREDHALAEHVTELEEVRNRKVAKREMGNATLTMLKRACQSAESDNSCTLCTRKFLTPSERETFLTTKRKELKELPTLVEKLNSEIENMEMKLKDLKLLEPTASR